MPFTLHHGECVDVLRTLPASSVDSVVTDPPYELKKVKGGSGGGFMGKRWDATGVAFDPATWAEVLRVLKPGGHLLAFGAPRTYHRMTCAIEDAGFEIRDSIHWIFGSGFPKSLDVRKAIDKMADASDAARQWDGWGTALKPAHEPIVVARKPLIGTVAENVLQHGTGALNIDGCRVPTTDDLGGGAEKGTRPEQKGNEGWTRPWMADESAREAHAARVRENVEKAEALGRWPANVVHDGSDAVLSAFPNAPGQMADISTTARSPKTSNVYGRMAREGEASANSGNGGAVGFKMKPGARRLDVGSAARFFYCAKASSADRNAGLGDPGIRFRHGTTLRQVENAVRDGTVSGNNHPTVKPTTLMRWLCRLVTPPGGVVLDPFMGSGSTGKACMLEGFAFIGIEREDEYIRIAKARIEDAATSAGVEPVKRDGSRPRSTRQGPSGTGRLTAPVVRAESAQADLFGLEVAQ